MRRGLAFGDPYPPPTEGEAWYVTAGRWVVNLFGGSCAEPNPATWQEHYLTRCLGGERWNGEPCPGTPDARRLAAAAKADPTTAETIRRNLAAWNDGWAPTVQEMQEPAFALLWGFAVAGGIDCHNSRNPDYPAQVWAWAERVTPGWSPPEWSELPPGSPYDSGTAEELYRTARQRGREAAEDLLRRISAELYGAIPREYREAVERGIRDHYTGGLAGGATAAVPLLIGGGLLLALAKRGRRR